jgi:serine/threonine-protein kinase
MGDVWMAKNLVTGGHVAVKRCREDNPDGEASARFRHEAQLGAMLSHRGIVRVFDFVEGPGGSPLLVMELLRGESLERRLVARGALPEREAIAIAVAVLAALAHAHDRGVLHRDVTPANVFLAVDPDGHVIPKLVDFGLAKAPSASVHTSDGRVLGTPRYMAPERIRGGGDIDARADLFAVGVVLYEMLTGICPFAAGSPAASLAAVLEVVVDPDPRISPPVWIELQRALAKRPYERHATARELSDALAAATGETEASLAECLRGAPQPDDAPLSLQNGSFGAFPGRTGAFGASGSRALRWLAVPAIVLVVLVGAVALRRAPVEPVAGSTAPVASPAPDPLVPAEPLASTPPPSAPQSSAAPPPRHSNHARPKPIATTPGF